MNYNELIEKLKNKEYVIDKIVVKPYIPFNTKYFIAKSVAENLLDTREDGLKYISSLKTKMISDLLLIKYTNIEKDNNDFSLDEYDFLSENGFFSLLKETLDANAREDYQLLLNGLEKEANELVKQYNAKLTGVVGIAKQIIDATLTGIVAQYQTEDGKKAIESFLKDLNNNTELKDFINSTLTRMNLDNYKEELLKRIKKINEQEKQDNINQK